MTTDRSHALLLPAVFITSLGNNIQLIAAALLIVRAQGSVLDVGWLFIAVAVPQAVLSPPFGRLADRFDRRTLWVACDALSALAALAMPLGLAMGGARNAVVYGSNFVLAVIAALFVPVSAALVKERVPAGELRRFNAHYEMALQSGMLLSATVGGIALQFFGPTPLCVFNGITFAVSAVLVLATGRAGRRPAAPRITAGTPAPAAPARSPLGPVIMLYAQGSVVVTVFNALMPVLVIADLHRGPAVVGVVDALGGAGFLVAAAAYRITGARLGDLRLALAGFLLCNVLFALQPRFGVPGLLLLVPLGALLFGQARIASRTLLMASVGEHRVGRAFGVANGWGLAATVAVMLATAAVTARAGTAAGFAAVALVSALAALASAAWHRAALRSARTPEPLPTTPATAPADRYPA
ncbi:MFS transporter [Streptomyces sp. MI02-7b]|uniref:MFS transporter n=1 Tax=Streptomyces sp. MI02-7b TaxID=462941 RepID=UPI0029B5298D|nr:MFS transporter [Streptomyces sp. MI02-7b]MDX3077589.1 MFS transporter [Streptomyces sp. MI02-7b]